MQCNSAYNLRNQSLLNIVRRNLLSSKYFFIVNILWLLLKLIFLINKVLLFFGSKKNLGKVAVKVPVEHKKSHILQRDRNILLKIFPLPFLYQHFQLGFQFIGLFLCVMLSIYSFKYLCTFQFFLSFLALLLPSLQKLFYPHHKYTYKGFPNKAKLKCRISGFEVTMLMEYMGEDTATRQDVYLERETEAHPSLS